MQHIYLLQNMKLVEQPAT